MNKIELNFIPCEPAPTGGYNIGWRVAGTGDAFTNAGNFFVSPAIFYDTINPAGTCYEGYIKSDNGDLDCNVISWSSCFDSGDPDPEYRITLIGSCLPHNVQSSYLISGGTVGDIVTVRATFSGILQKNINIFTKACVGLASVDGVSDPDVCSTCYTDTAMHGFTITADSIITMPGATAVVILSAVVHNGSETPTSVILTIIDVNGNPENISVAGCRGNSGTGGTC